MIPVITINGLQLTPSQIRLLRKLILDYILSLSEMIWEYVEKSDPAMASLPNQRTLCLELLEMIDGVRRRVDYAVRPEGVNISINKMNLAYAYGEIARMVLSCGPVSVMTPEEMIDRNVILRVIFKNT